MRSFHPAILAALAALLVFPSGAHAAGGGAAWPASSSGGASPGAIGTARPVASLFQVSPLSVREGRLPGVRFRVDEPGVERVRVRLAVVPLSRGASAPLSAPLGSFPTGRVRRAVWPRGARLKAGRYLVRLHVVDPLGRTLLRGARASGRVGLTVLPAPKPKKKKAPAPAVTTPSTPTPTSGSTAPPPPVAPPPAVSSEISDGVFPVAGAHTYGDGIGAAREGHTHQGQDLVAAEGVPVVAPTAGTITYTKYQSHGAGYWVLERAADGRDFFFAHCRRGSFAVVEGQAVRAGQQLCQVGSTGDASGPHLHFEIWVGGWRTGGDFVDPLAQLRHWDSARR